MIIENYETHEHLAKVAMRDERLVVTQRRANFASVRRFMKPGHCLLLSIDMKGDELVGGKH